LRYFLQGKPESRVDAVKFIKEGATGQELDVTAPVLDFFQRKKYENLAFYVLGVCLI
jgi:hypothetical protein